MKPSKSMKTRKPPKLIVRRGCFEIDETFNIDETVKNDGRGIFFQSTWSPGEILVPSHFPHGCCAGYRYQGRTELTEVSGIDTEIVPNLNKGRVPALMPYRALPKSSVVFTESIASGIPRLVPCRTHRWIILRCV